VKAGRRHIGIAHERRVTASSASFTASMSRSACLKTCAVAKPQVAGRTDDLDRNLDAIGDEDLRDRHRGRFGAFQRSSS
jgi:hypothetical protein